MIHGLNFQAFPSNEPSAAIPARQTSAAAPTLLLVDDEKLIVDSLGTIFRRSGFNVFTAYSGAEALGIALETPPDLLLTDVSMPGMDGIELAIHIAGAIPACKILLFSAHASTLDLTPARQQGYDFALLAKPMHPKQMITRITECLAESMALAS